MRQVLGRLGQAILTVFGALTIVFLILRVTPGDPIQIMLGDYATPELVQVLRQQYGLDQPIPIQYGIFLKNALTGNFGISLAKKYDIATIVTTAFPFTLSMALAAMVVTCLIGLPLGILSALKRNTAIDYAAMSLSLLGISTPGFLLALIMIYLLSYKLGLFPIVGAGEDRGPLGMIHYLILPALALGLQAAALVARTTRSALLGVMSEDYVRTARAKGLGERAVLRMHVLRNALVPILAVLGLYFAQLLGGSAVIEMVFGRPGMGKLLVEAILTRDYPLSQALITVFLVGVITVNVITDALYGLADPRIRQG